MTTSNSISCPYQLGTTTTSSNSLFAVQIDNDNIRQSSVAFLIKTATTSNRLCCCCCCCCRNQQQAAFENSTRIKFDFTEFREVYFIFSISKSVLRKHAFPTFVKRGQKITSKTGSFYSLQIPSMCIILLRHYYDVLSHSIHWDGISMFELYKFKALCHSITK